MTSAQLVLDQAPAALYAYDADGRRVKREAGAGGGVWQVYGAGGELLAEYAAGAPPSRPRKEYGYRAGELLVTAQAPTRENVALASAGATVTARSHTADGVFAGLHFRPSYANDGRRYATAQGDGYWRDEHGLASWLEVDFGGQRTIDEVDLYTLADHPAYTAQSDPSATQTFTQYGVTSFQVQYWDGATWAAVPGGSVSGNSLVWKKITFPAVTTSRIRVVVNLAADGVARVTEVEAWGTAGPPRRVNAALHSEGGQASASSTTPDAEFPGLTFPVSSINNGDRKGLNWEHGGGWRDGTNNSYPDWAQVEFAGERAIDEIDVLTVQDAISSPVEPTESLTFTQYGATTYEVQYWSGSAWVTTPGGSVSGNDKVWRRFTFPAVTTTKVRVVIHGALAGRSRLVEVEAWGTAAASKDTDVQWLVSDHLGTPRMVVAQAGSLAGVKRHDYMPFGEELFAGTGGRTTGQGYSQLDGNRMRWAKLERDDETGLDYAQARYYASTSGRFTSIDPFNIILERQKAPKDEKFAAAYKEFIGSPQRWNRYVYAVNSPTVFTDKTGLDIMIIENGPTNGINSRTEGNPIGHTAIAITGRGVYSMGNADGEPQQDNKNNILGGSVKDYILREIGKRDTKVIIIKTTPEQDAAAAKKLEDVAASRDMLTESGILSDNCSIRVNEALTAAGVTSDNSSPFLNPTKPGSAGLRAVLYGKDLQVLNFPRDSNLLESDRRVIQQFEPKKRN